MKIRLYFDEDAMDDDLVAALRARGVDVETAYEAGMIEREDDEQLAHASAQGRVIYTFNTGHFCRLHAAFLSSGQHHAGIVVSHQQRFSIGSQMRRLLNLIAVVAAEEMCDRLEFLSDWPERNER
jgi:hypothetical protein